VNGALVIHDHDVAAADVDRFQHGRVRKDAPYVSQQPRRGW
jgi:hypothetical protein